MIAAIVSLSDFTPVLMRALAWSLLDFLWQGALVGWGAAWLLAAMRHRSAQARYALACGALLLCAALPLAGLLTRVGAGAMAPAAMLASASAPLALVAPLAGAMASPAAALALDWQGWLQARLPLVLLLWAAGAGLLALRLLLGLL